MPEAQARKKSTKTNFLDPETARWGGGLSREGVVAESSCPPSKVCLPWVSKRGIWDVPGILPGCPGPFGVFKKFVQKMFLRIFRSLEAARVLPEDYCKEDPCNFPWGGELARS